MIRYFIYARKSQDRSDRQVMSIDGQINEIKRLAKQNGFVIADILTEQKSAKQPGRPVFNEMIKRLNKGEANGVLCWKLNRVARNPVDAGTISWLLQGNIIKAIHSVERSYLPTDNVLMMQIDFGIANQFVKDLSSDVKRGLRDKARDGWNPQSVLPIGYIHHPETQNATKQIIIDPDRFPIIKELWKRIETGAHSIIDIKRIADDLGLINRKGKPYALSTFYLLFQNPMYYGKFYWKDENGKITLWNGKHTAAVSEHQFRSVQKIIANRNQNIGSQSHVYTYRGLITCGGCNGHVSAERKLQVICTNCKHKYSILTNEICRKCETPYSKMINPSKVDKVYYRCTRRKVPSCREKSISEADIEKSIIQTLEKFSIPDELYDWIKERLVQQTTFSHSDNDTLIDSLRRRKDSLQIKLNNLIELRLSGELSREESDSFRNDYQSSIDKLKDDIFQKENALDLAISENQTYLDFAKKCVERFKIGNHETKKEISAFFCSNLTLFNKTLYFSTKKTPIIFQSLQNMILSNLACSNLGLSENIRALK